MKKKRRLFSRILVYGFLIVSAVVSIFPFYWMVAGMTNSAVDVVTGKMTFGGEFINNVKNLFTNYNLPTYFFNSLKISGLTVIGVLAVSSLAAYGFEFYASKARERTFRILLLSMMVPFAALMIPLFKLIVKLHLLNTHTGLILTSLASVFMIFFFRQNFKTFPKEIIQAARVDGASEFKIFYSIVIPSVKSTFAAGAIYAFMSSWNAYLWPLIMFQTDNKKTMVLLLSIMTSAYTPPYGAIMVAIVITTLPMIIIFFALQKHFVQGITGSIKQ
jgi:lactose/L-arabinose transport system permease protein